MSGITNVNRWRQDTLSIKAWIFIIVYVAKAFYMHHMLNTEIIED